MFVGEQVADWFRRSTGISIAILLGIIVGGVPLGIGLTAIGKGFYEWWWPSTAGKITLSCVHERVSSHWDKEMQRHEQTSNYEAVIHYRYSVDDKEFSGTAPGGAVVLGWKLSNILFWFKSQAATLVAKYPEGSAVTVYYNPRDPAVSVLERGPNLTGVLFVIIGAVIIGLGVMWGLLPSPRTQLGGK
jgi:hypothetical protein